MQKSFSSELLNQQIDLLQKQIRELTARDMTSLDIMEVCELSMKLSRLLATQLDNKKAS